jgi:acyl-CoA thioester hydrolase
MSTTASRPPAGRRADYRWFHAITTRWSDNDMFHHVNNVVYFSFFDTAVTYYEMSEGVCPMIGGPIRALVAEAQCRYHQSLSYPDRVTVGLRVSRVGVSSATFELAVFRDDDDAACAEGRFVHVFCDAETQRPVPIPAEARERLAAVAA